MVWRHLTARPLLALRMEGHQPRNVGRVRKETPSQSLQEETQLCQRLDLSVVRFRLGFPPTEMQDNKFVLFKYHQVCGNFL